uniref:Leucine rich repeat containing 73 n=1 Tax=Scleropages formosus TaxID=113540 RepID=A0A8C9WCE3_SCLFO
MLPGSIQITGEALSGAEIKDICESLKEDSVRLLSVRGCQLSDRDFGRLCRGVAESRSLAQLNLNLGVVSGVARVKHLADALKSNRSIQTLFLHGSPLLDAGLVALNAALSTHPSLVSLDLGDCMLGDEAVQLICGMLPPDGAKSGLRELTLSANPAITTKGWARLAIAVAHSSQLRVLNLDYNPLDFPGHGGELPHLPARAGARRERHQPRAAAADLGPAVRGGGGREQGGRSARHQQGEDHVAPAQQRQLPDGTGDLRPGRQPPGRDGDVSCRLPRFPYVAHLRGRAPGSEEPITLHDL